MKLSESMMCVAAIWEARNFHPDAAQGLREYSKAAMHLEAENEALMKYVETYHDEDYVMWRREQDALLKGEEK